MTGRGSGAKRSSQIRTVRVAGYCRQSVSDQLEFHSVAAQADAIVNYVAARASDGWTLLAAEFHDRGYSGGTLERPGYQALLQTIEAGSIDVVVVHRLDRISRSLSDFVSFVALLDRHGVGFVAVTQAFDTTTSIGRLTMNLLGCFSEFERACISERTRAKFVAARQRGLWVTGRPPLGYDLVKGELVVNDAEAATANEVFALYLRCGSLRDTIAELDRRGIRTKLNSAKDGHTYGGSRFSKQVLAHMLANPVYLGELRSGSEVLPGKHEAIIDRATWDLVQERLRQNARSTNSEHRNRYGALLRGIAHCGVCGSPMRHDITTRQGRAYRYYSCRKLQVEGAQACPGSRAPGPELEQFVLDRVRGVGSDPRVFDAAVIAARAEADALRPSLQAQVRRLQAEHRKLEVERDGLFAAAAENPGSSGPALSRVAEIEACFPSLDQRTHAARDELKRLDSRAIDLHDLREQLAGFDSLFEQLTSTEQCRLIALVIERVDVDVPRAAIRVTFRGTPPTESVRTTA